VKLVFLVEVEMKVSVFGDLMPKNVVRNTMEKKWKQVLTKRTHKMSAQARR